LELLSTKFVETAFGVNNRRLIVSMPPRHGKSEHSSHYAPVWYLDLYPDRRFALATYGADYSREWGEKIRDTVDANPLDVRLKWRSRRTNALSTVQGGNVWSVGLRGGLTGRGLHGLGIDDPHKDWEEANSIVYRDKAWNWYTSTARSRLDPVREGPKPFVVVTMTRWHEDDLAGRLIEEQGTIDDGGLWEVVSLPAIAVDDNDPLGRKPGEALWPEMVSKEDLLETKAEVGEYVWEALYQGNPSPPAGTILLRKWWRYYESFPSGLDLDATYMSWDMSFKDSEGSDFVVGQVWGIRGANRILLDQVRDRMSFTTTCATMKTLAAKWPDAVAKYVEDTANGPAVIDALRGTIPGLVPVPAVGSKTSRAQACTPYLQAGNVWIPDPKLAPWVEDFVRECAIFPKGPQDDQVDAFTQAMIHSGVASSVVLGGYAPHKRGAGRR
jgi:predicted phage terminase large subunit-like protein